MTNENTPTSLWDYMQGHLDEHGNHWADVARAVGMSSAAVRKWGRGEHPIPVRHIATVAAVLQVPENQLRVAAGLPPRGLGPGVGVLIPAEEFVSDRSDTVPSKVTNDDVLAAIREMRESVERRLDRLEESVFDGGATEGGST